MGASRKLQGEIDRVLKKVQEGVDVFDSIWNKVYDTENANQKEKFEADLKKEIKKLQRYRDQIKTWIQSSEIKDKKVSASYEQALMDARKLIEREMERFKVCEKETKTKAFSKEGLGQQPKTDPKEKAKSETRDWVNTTVGDLENQIDTFEAEAEGFSGKKGKTKNPRLAHLETSICRHKAHIMKLELILRLLDNDELSPDQVNDLKDFLEDYVECNQDDFERFDDVDEFYSSLPLEKVEALEDIISLCPSGLSKPALSITSQQNTEQDQSEETASHEGNSDAAPKSPSIKSVATNSTPSSPTALNRPTTPTASARPFVTGGPVASSVPTTPTVSTGVGNDSSSASIPSPVNLSPTTNRGISNQTVSGVSDVNKRANPSVDDGASGRVTPPLVSPLSNRTNDGAILNDGNGTVENPAFGGRVQSPSIPADTQWRAQGSPAFPNQNEVQFRGRPDIADMTPGQREMLLQRFQQMQQQQQQQQQQGHNTLLTSPHLPGANQKQFPIQPNSLLQQFNAQSSLMSPQHGMGLNMQPTDINSIAFAQSSQRPLNSSTPKDAGLPKADEQQNVSEDPNVESTSSSLNKMINEEDTKLSYGGEGNQSQRDNDFSQGQQLQQSQSSSNLSVIGRRSVSDLGAIGDNSSGPAVTSSMKHDKMYNMQMLEAAFYKLPQPRDSERAKTIPKNPAVTPSSFPQTQADIVENPAFWERLGSDPPDADLLFFAFYYQQNTYQQYLAARELKRQSWRYHRKYHTWFQRHEEPTVSNEEFEKGTYLYFDFHLAEDGYGWRQRIETEFTFEYNYLEDELVV